MWGERWGGKESHSEKSVVFLLYWIPFHECRIFLFLGLHPRYDEVHSSVIFRKKHSREFFFTSSEQYVHAMLLFVDSLAAYRILEWK